MTVRDAIWSLNETFDRLSPAHKRYAMLGLLIVLPVTLTLLLDTSFEDESAQALWLVWLGWVLAPRAWYCHATGQSPWRR